MSVMSAREECDEKSWEERSGSWQCGIPTLRQAQGRLWGTGQTTIPRGSIVDVDECNSLVAPVIIEMNNFERRPVIGAFCSFTKIARAFLFQESGRHFGKVCIEY
jgi:hypothetical protein